MNVLLGSEKVFLQMTRMQQLATQPDGVEVINGYNQELKLKIMNSQGLVMRVEKVVGMKVKLRLSHTELHVCEKYSLETCHSQMNWSDRTNQQAD
jgi:hypothetical protein